MESSCRGRSVVQIAFTRVRDHLKRHSGGEVIESQAASGDQGSGAGGMEVVPSGDEKLL